MDLVQYLQSILDFELPLHLPPDKQQKLLTTLAAMPRPEVPNHEQPLLPPVADAQKEIEMPKETNIIMPNTEPPGDFYLSKSKKISSPKKRFRISLDIQFTQYSTMTK